MFAVAVSFCVLAIALSSPVKQGPQQKSQLCDQCTALVDKYITEAFIQQILAQGSKACESLPGKLADSCKQLIDQYGPQITSEILANKDQLCVNAHLCAATKIGHSYKTNPLMHSTKDDTQLSCDGCRIGTQVLGDILTSKLFQEDLYEMLRTAACPAVGTTQDPVCVSTISALYQSLISLIQSVASCRTICKPIPNCQC